MAGSDYATNADLLELRRDLVDTERLLRARDDDMDKQVRADFHAEIMEFKSEVSAQFTEVKEGLKTTASKDDVEEIKDRISWQNKVWLVPLISTILLGILYVFLHFVFKIG